MSPWLREPSPFTRGSGSLLFILLCRPTRVEISSSSEPFRGNGLSFARLEVPEWFTRHPGFSGVSLQSHLHRSKYQGFRSHLFISLFHATGKA